MFANDIGYTPSNPAWKKENGEDITNVKDAIDELYKSASISESTLIINKAESISSISFTPSSEYKYYILTNVYFAAGSNYSNNVFLEINDVVNANYILTGFTGRNDTNSSGATRSYLIIPDGSSNDISVSFKGNVDSVSIYGIK